MAKMILLLSLVSVAGAGVTEVEGSVVNVERLAMNEAQQLGTEDCNYAVTVDPADDTGVISTRVEITRQLAEELELIDADGFPLPIPLDDEDEADAD